MEKAATFPTGEIGTWSWPLPLQLFWSSESSGCVEQFSLNISTFGELSVFCNNRMSVVRSMSTSPVETKLFESDSRVNIFRVGAAVKH